MIRNYQELPGNVKSRIRNEEVSGSIPLGSTNQVLAGAMFSFLRILNPCPQWVAALTRQARTGERTISQQLFWQELIAVVAAGGG